MPRARFIHPDAQVDPEFARHSRDTRLFFWYVLTIADDAGNFTADTRELKAKVYPYDDDIGPTEIVEFLQSLTEDSVYIRYVFGKYSLYHIKNFSKYQKPEYPSAPKYPLFPGQVYTYCTREKGKSVKKTVLENDYNWEVFGESSANTQRVFDSNREGKGIVNSQPTPPPPDADPETGPDVPAPGPAHPPENGATPLDYTQQAHWDLMSQAQIFGIDYSSTKTVEELTQIIDSVPQSVKRKALGR